MRIITGIHKGRRFDIPSSFKARPTTDFAKENIFNVIQGYIDIADTEVLDLFGGTGSISLEFISRECRNLICVEMDKDHLAFIKKCMQTISADNALVLRADVVKFISKCRKQFDIIFADPPYRMTHLESIPQMILDNDLLKPDGILILEHGKDHDFSSHPHILDHRRYGSVNFSIFGKTQTKDGLQENS